MSPTVTPASRSEVQNAVDRQQSDPSPPLVVQPCAGLCWIEIELLDDEDRGVPREPYWLQLPDGQIREGKLNDRGQVRFDNIACGICKVRFPRYDGQFVQALAAHTADRAHWLEIALLDEKRKPCAGEPYVVTLPDGAIQEGKLDKQGYARLSGLSAGVCLVRFPQLNQQDLIS